MIKNKEVEVDNYIISIDYEADNGDIVAIIITGDVMAILRDSFLNRITDTFYGSLLDEQD